MTPDSGIGKPWFFGLLTVTECFNKLWTEFSEISLAGSRYGTMNMQGSFIGTRILIYESSRYLIVLPMVEVRVLPSTLLVLSYAPLSDVARRFFTCCNRVHSLLRHQMALIYDVSDRSGITRVFYSLLVFFRRNALNAQSWVLNAIFEESERPLKI